MKVYLDDERLTPDGWRRVYWPEEAIELLKTGKVTEISLDHDLGDDERGTGYDVILWIEEAVATKGFHPPIIHTHSANPSARRKMKLGIASIRQFSKAHDRFNPTGQDV
ncbi:cyclic-phosphate processing receiver domain-containing protein [Thermodesulfobacteriota bacterium]